MKDNKFYVIHVLEEIARLEEFTPLEAGRPQRTRKANWFRRYTG